jgi:nitrogen fixation protein
MRLQLGSINGTLIDGSTSWGAAAEDALATWNNNLANMQFSVERDSTASLGYGNGINNVFWSSTVYGDAWDNRTLAVTLSQTNMNNVRLESDVIFNTNFSWNSYRGSLRTASGGSTLYDFHRVAMHEFGHVLGLNHPDDIGQKVTALMNAVTSNTDGLVADDIAGGHAIYDSGTSVTGGVTLYMQGSVSYSYAGTSLNLQVTRVQNDGAAGSVSGTLRLELWAMPQHYDNGLPTGSRQLGYYTFQNVLSAGYGFPNVNVNTTFTSPPNGAYYVALLLTEFTGSSGSGYTIRDFREFDNQIVIGNPAAPSITAQPYGETINAGTSVVLNVVASGAPPLTYQWFKNGVAIAGATNVTLTIPSAQSIDAGTYTVAVRNSVGAVTSTGATLTVNFSRLANLSVRAPAGTGDQTLIVGFYIGGTGSKQVLIRGVGPTLAQYGVGGVLADPQLKLFNVANTQINQNDDWGGGTALANAFAVVNDFALPANSKDAALLVTLPLGGYSAQVNGAGTSTGVAMIEAYEADTSTPGARFTALSARNQVGTSDNIIIAGFVVTGNAPKTLLIRGIGPTLANYGVGGVLADPKLDLYSGNTRIDGNDNWGGTTTLSNAFTATQAFPLPANSKDAALLVTLQPGLYSAQVSGVGGTTGVALVEVYEMP